MAASKTRIDWSLLLLRLAVGGLALLQGFTALRHAHAGASFSHAAVLAMALAEMVCGGLVVIGLWTPLTAGILVLLAVWPLAQGWFHGAGVLGHPAGLFRVMATLACAIGGGGRWAVDR